MAAYAIIWPQLIDCQVPPTAVHHRCLSSSDPSILPTSHFSSESGSHAPPVPSGMQSASFSTSSSPSHEWETAASALKALGSWQGLPPPPSLQAPPSPIPPPEQH